MPIIRAYFDCMNRIYAERGIRGLFEVRFHGTRVVTRHLTCHD
jgi:hypothetical protein